MPSGGDALHCACRRAIASSLNPGSSARMRSSSGGWVANNLPAKSWSKPTPSPNSMWLTSSASLRWLSSRSIVQATDLLQRAGQPCVCRVNCTAAGIGQFSRVRLTPALIIRPKNSPT
jgi:hypothetical protein